MPEQPLVTIVTPSFNQGEFIGETIESVLNQTYPHIEYIVVDGGSTDNTVSVVERYLNSSAGRCINTFIHERDKGQSDAINKGFRLAKGQLVGWINSDDLLYPDCVERIVALSQKHPGGSIYYGAKTDLINRAGQVFDGRHIPIPGRHHLLHQNYDIIQQGSFYASALVREVGYLDESVQYCMDLDLWLRLLTHGPIYALNDGPLAAFRIWETTKTTTGGERFLTDIRQVLLRNGATRWSPSVRHVYYESLKVLVKKALQRL
jgi:glycosyltransferase involved in cell wall biosynthesis